jgi:hypothetical protein
VAEFRNIDVENFFEGIKGSYRANDKGLLDAVEDVVAGDYLSGPSDGSMGGGNGSGGSGNGSGGNTGCLN